MADGTSTPTPDERPPGMKDIAALNAKIVQGEEIKDLSELRDKFEQLGLQTLVDLHKNAEEIHQVALKTLSDAQSAANVHLLNVIGTAQKVSEDSWFNLSDISADKEIEQETAALGAVDDMLKVMQGITVALTGIAAAMQAVASNMATGRPPVNQSGTTATPVAAPAGT